MDGRQKRKGWTRGSLLDAWLVLEGARGGEDKDGRSTWVVFCTPFERICQTAYAGPLRKAPEPKLTIWVRTPVDLSVAEA